MSSKDLTSSKDFEVVIIDALSHETRGPKMKELADALGINLRAVSISPIFT